MPLVSIIIPVYNTEKYLKKCLDSVVNQTYKNIEIIVINDASTDQSLSILKNYTTKYKNIKLINNPFNLGLSYSRNIGLDASNGDFIYFVDSDDYLNLDAIKKMVALAYSYNVPLVCAKHQNVFLKHQIFSPQENIETHYIDLEKEKKEFLNQIGTAWNKLYQHELIENFRFPEGLYYEDNAFFYPILTKAKQLVKSNDILYFYRRHLNSITLSDKINPNPRVFDIYSILDILKQNCIDFNTYTNYENEIEEITKLFAIVPLLNASTWFKVTKEDRQVVLANLYQYVLNRFQINNIMDIPIIQKKYERNELYKLRITYTMMQIKRELFKEEYKQTLEPAKRIINKYKR